MFTTDTIKTGKEDLIITFIGHGTLMFTFGDLVIHIDPAADMADYTQLPKGDIILVTHERYIAEHASRIVRLRDGLIEIDESIPGKKRYRQLGRAIRIAPRRSQASRKLMDCSTFRVSRADGRSVSSSTKQPAT